MITLKVLKDKEECKKIWDNLSPKKHLWDLWDFRYCFYQRKPNFYFLTAYEKEKPVGLIPLIYTRASAEYLYFGDMFPEQNKFFIKKKEALKELLEACPYETSVYYINKSETKFHKFQRGERRYFLNLKKYSHDIDNYLMTFKKKHRKNLRYDIRKLKEKGCKVKLNNTEDFEVMAKLNRQSFDDSDYKDKNFEKSIKKIMNIAKKNNFLDMISLELEGKIQAVGIGIIFNKTYCVIAMGRNIEIANIGKLLIYEQICSAMKKGCNYIDFLSTESGWKNLWKLDYELMYEWNN